MSVRRARAARAAVVSMTLLAPLALITVATGPAHAAVPDVWDRLAACESGGDWQIDTGNGYHGGLQFAPATWQAYGGRAYAPTADRASRAQQIEIAAAVQRAQGWGAWPTCAARLGLYGASPAARQPDGARAKSGGGAAAERPASHQDRSHRRAPQALPAAASAAGGPGTYTVRPGDTLSTVAAAHGTRWRALHRQNRAVVGEDPHLIHPGQRLTL